MVKSISIVHNAYAVAANSRQSDIAFCLLYVFGWRMTWAVLPWSILALSLLSLLPLVRRLQVRFVKRNISSVLSIPSSHRAVRGAGTDLWRGRDRLVARRRNLMSLN